MFWFATIFVFVFVVFNDHARGQEAGPVIAIDVPTCLDFENFDPLSVCNSVNNSTRHRILKRSSK